MKTSLAIRIGLTVIVAFLAISVLSFGFMFRRSDLNAESAIPAPEKVAATVRAMHHTIKGVRPDGLPYDADDADWKPLFKYYIGPGILRLVALVIMGVATCLRLLFATLNCRSYLFHPVAIISSAAALPIVSLMSAASLQRSARCGAPPDVRSGWAEHALSARSR